MGCAAFCLYFAGACCLVGQIQNQPEDGQWLMPAKNYASTRYSELDQINSGNVKNLKTASTFSTGIRAATKRPRSSSAARCTSSRPTRTSVRARSRRRRP